MATNNYFGYELTNGDTAVEKIESHGYTGFTPWAVNASAGNETASLTLAQWKDSPPRNANLLGAGLHEIGVARAYSATATYGWYWVVTFGGGRPA